MEATKKDTVRKNKEVGVYTNNLLTKRLFSERGYYVKSPKMYDREKFSGTKIRQKMINGENWAEYVPVEVAKVIEKLDGVKRIQELGHV